MAPGRNLTAGTVLRWYLEEGWGVLVAAAVDGLVFVHYSMIRDQPGYRELTVGQAVMFTWEQYPSGQDGCPNRAIDVYTTSVRQPVARRVRGPGASYRSSLLITFDDPPNGAP